MKQKVLKAVGLVGAAIVDPLNARERYRARLRYPTDRTTFLRDVPLADALEIGPFDNPTIAGPGVAYFDVLDAPALRERAARVGYGGDRIPQRIDFVSPTGDLAVVDRHFDAVLSSHAIEHQPDLVAHLRGVARLLNPGGRYFLIVPDRRYTFDHYLTPTTLADVMQAHEEGRRFHTRAAILDHRLATTHNNPLRHWLGLHGAPASTPAMCERAEAEAVRSAAGEYVDVHAWMFDPAGFAALMTALHATAGTGLAVERVHATRFADLEFFAVLRRDP